MTFWCENCCVNDHEHCFNLHRSYAGNTMCTCNCNWEKKK